MSRKYIPPEFIGGASAAYVRGAQARRYGHAAGAHEDKRTRRHRDRGTANRAAIAASRHQ